MASEPFDPTVYGPVRILSVPERDRLVELIDIQNTATQVDRDESVEFRTLLDKLLNN